MAEYLISTFLFLSLLVIACLKTVKYRDFSEKILEIILYLTTVAVVMISFYIIYILLSKTVIFFSKVPIASFFSLDWNPLSSHEPSYGILPLLNGTLLIMFIAIFFFSPFAVFSAIYLSELCGKKARTLIKPFIELIAGIPTVVFGYFAIIFVAPLVKNFADYIGIESSQENALTAGIVMGIMVTPYIISLVYDVLQDVPDHQKRASFALGATESETIINMTLPTAKWGILAVIMLAVSRAIGETMIVTMAAGLVAKTTLNPFESLTTITTQIVSLVSGDQEFDSPAILACFVLALCLLLLTFYINAYSQRVMKKFKNNFR